MLRLGVGVKSYERPAQWLPIVHPFSQENEMLTPKMSLRRNVIRKVYDTELQKMYSGSGGHKIASSSSSSSSSQ
jgi:long-subunit acyl-CoA synthetase (AMP-forming)